MAARTKQFKVAANILAAILLSLHMVRRQVVLWKLSLAAMAYWSTPAKIE